MQDDMEEQAETVERVRVCGLADAGELLAIINAAAEAYRGVIPADRWHEPYMPADELAAELADGVAFSGIEAGGRIVGVMGLQPQRNIDLIRHAYVLPEWQGHGVGSRLLNHLCHDAKRPILIGTWAAAEWAIRFYERHGFACVARDDIAPLLRTYWNVPDRQVDTSIVLASPPLTNDATNQLIANVKK